MKNLLLAAGILLGCVSPSFADDSCDAVGARLYPLFLDVMTSKLGIDRDDATTMWPRDKAIDEMLGGMKSSPDFNDATCDILLVMPDTALKGFLNVALEAYLKTGGA